MEAKFRPVPITILDFLAILLPGFIWLILIDTTLQVFLHWGDAHNVSPATAWESIVSSTKQGDSLFVTVSLVIISLLVGYILKPLAMAAAEPFTRFFFVLQDTKHLPIARMKFPFNEYFENDHDAEEDSHYYKGVVALLEKKMKCSPEKLYGHQPFGAAKRYLRLVAPTLWEESERMEAEVRMTGAMFLASLYSFVLSLFVLICQIAGALQSSNKAVTVWWFVLSLLTTVILAIGFTRLRIREVGYTYVNALIASGCGASILKPGTGNVGNSVD